MGNTERPHWVGTPWKMIIGSQASLPVFCNMEGFNAYSGASHSRARIGILGNEQNDCLSPDSRISFGTGGYPEESNTCGNLGYQAYGADNVDTNIKSTCYVLVM